MRVGGYVRLSRDEDKESYSSILTQKSIIEECARQNQWTVGRYYEDDNCSGYSFDRPGFNALLRDLENNRIDVVIAKDLSRIGRHNAYTLLFIDNIRRLGKRLVLPKEGEGYDSGRDESDLLGIKTWYNEMYVKDISRKIKSSIKAKQREGRLIVKECFGYIRSHDDKHRLEVDLEAAETVKLIFSLYLSGLGYRKIAEILNSQGCPTPYLHARYRKSNMAYAGSAESIWTPSAVQRILRNDIYVGTLRLGKTEKPIIKGKSISKPESQQYVFEENHTPIISRQQFDEAQSMLAARKKTGNKGAASRDNIFSGLLYCMDCGARMIAYNKAGKAKSYICSSYHRYGKSSCRRHSIRENDLISIVKEYLKAAAENQKEAIMKTSLEEWNPDTNDNKRLLQELKQELSVMREKYKMLIIQKITDMRKENSTEYKNIIKQSFEELEKSFQNRILYLEKKIYGLEEKLPAGKGNNNGDALELLQRIIDKPSLSRRDVEILIERIDMDSNGNLLVRLMGNCTSICYHTPEDANLVPGP